MCGTRGHVMPLPATQLPDLDQDLVTSVEELERIVGTPAPLSLDKVSPVLPPGMQAFVTQSPFYLLGTSSDDGPCDVSPRGDPAGAVLVRDDRTLLLPDRRGNKRVDSLRNILRNPCVGLLFLIPGSDETLRVNGRARLSRNPDLLALMPMRGVLPMISSKRASASCAVSSRAPSASTPWRNTARFRMTRSGSRSIGFEW